MSVWITASIGVSTACFCTFGLLNVEEEEEEDCMLRKHHLHDVIYSAEQKCVEHTMQSLTLSQACKAFFMVLTCYSWTRSYFSLCHISKTMVKECVMYDCVNSLAWTLVWLAPGGNWNSEFVVCF